MALLNYELARRQDGKVELRGGPLRARWNFSDLTTADGHKLSCTFNACVATLDEPTERQMLGETFLDRKPTLTVDDIVAHFSPALHAAVRKATVARNVSDWWDETQKETLAATLLKEAQRVAFACGLDVLPPMSVELESPSFQQQKLEATEQALAEQRVAGQVKHFERAAELLKQFEAIRQSAPELSPGAVLEQISPTDRGTMLQTLLLASAKSVGAQSLWSVAGPYLVRIDAHISPPKIDLLSLPPVLGPLRSVQAAQIDGKRVLLVGARSGVMVIDPDSAKSIAEPAVYTDPEVVSQLGFSRAVVWNNELWACHGDAGIVGWEFNQPGQPRNVLRPVHLASAAGGAGDPSMLSLPPLPASGTPPPVPMTQSMQYVQNTRSQGVRNLIVLDDGRLMFNFGRDLLTMDREGHATRLPRRSEAEIVTIIPDRAHVLVVEENGTICTHRRDSLDVISEQCRNMRVLAAGILPWLGTQRLLLAAEEGPLQCLGIDDALVTEYLGPHRGPRLVAGAADLVAAVSADRQRLALWNSWDGRRPIADLSLAAIAKRRIADIEFG